MQKIGHKSQVIPLQGTSKSHVTSQKQKQKKERKQETRNKYKVIRHK